MKKILPPVLCLLLLPLAPALRAAAGGQPPASQPEHPETELGESMSVIGKAWRQLRKLAPDSANNAESLAILADIQAAAKKGLTLSPDLAKDQPANKQADFVAGYRSKLQELLDGLGQLEALFKAGDNAGAVAQISKIGALQKEAHKEYKRPD